MEFAKPSKPSRAPVLFCCAIIAPLVIMWGGTFLALRYLWPHATGYRLLNIVLGFVLVEFIVTWTLLIAGWLRRERSRWLVLVAVVLSVACVWRIFFAGSNV